MLKLSFYFIGFLAFISSFANNRFASNSSLKSVVDTTFKLTSVTIGFGPNQDDVQPVFKVTGTNFLYTSEDVWLSADEKDARRDTLLKGSFRRSSIDSIMTVIENLSDTLIFKSRFTDGAMHDMTISKGAKKITFQLWNVSDTSVEKIVSILNTYITNERQKLSFSGWWKED